MSPEFSDKHFGATEEQLAQLMEPLLPKGAKWRVHRWRYAIPKVHYKDRFFERMIENYGCVYFAGDAFKESRVEGAFLSGTHVGARIKSKI